MIVLKCETCGDTKELEDGAQIRGMDAEKWFREKRDSRCKKHFIPDDVAVQRVLTTLNATVIRERPHD